MKNRFHSRHNDHLSPLDILDKNTQEQARSILKGLGGYQISKGIHHRKLAAAINYLRSLGYSTEQIQSAPLRMVVDLFGAWPESIKDTVNGGVPGNLPRVMREKNISVTPLGNFGTYQKPPETPSTLTSIVRDIYGPTFPEFGKPTPKNPDEMYIKFPPLVASKPTTTSMMKAIQETSTITPDDTPQKSVDISVLKPVAPVMTKGLQDAGYIAPTSLEPLSIMFYEKIVQPSTMQNSIDESLVDSILTFIGNVANRKAQGENLPPVLDKIGELTLKVQSSIENQAVKTGQFKLGEFITENSGWLIGGLLALFVLVFLVARKK